MRYNLKNISRIQNESIYQAENGPTQDDLLQIMEELDCALTDALERIETLEKTLEDANDEISDLQTKLNEAEREVMELKVAP